MNDQPTNRPGSSHSSEGEEESRSSGGTEAWMEALRDMGPYLDLGWRLAGTTAFPPVIGYALDGWMGTTPWILLVGCVFGLLGAVVVLKRLEDDFGH